MSKTTEQVVKAILDWEYDFESEESLLKATQVVVDELREAGLLAETGWEYACIYPYKTLTQKITLLGDPEVHLEQYPHHNLVRRRAAGEWEKVDVKVN